MLFPLENTATKQLGNNSFIYDGEKWILKEAIKADAIETFVFGNGLDGDVIIDSDIVMTLSRDTAFRNLTIIGNGKIFTNGFRLFVSRVLDLSQATGGNIINKPLLGTNGEGANDGVSGISISLSDAANSFLAAGSGGRGGLSNLTNNGTGAGAGANQNGGNGGNGSSGGLPVQGSGLGGTAATTFDKFLGKLFPITLQFAGFSQGLTGGSGGGGGGPGASDGTFLGGNGGGGAVGSKVLGLFCRILKTSVSTVGPVIQNLGGKGGLGANSAGGNSSGGGGGGGGGSGPTYIVVGEKEGPIVSNLILSKGGNGGDGGNGSGTGRGGGGAGGGGAGSVYLIQIYPKTFTLLNRVPNTAGVDSAPGTAGLAGVEGASNSLDY
jgi:hypothetical protein